MFCPWPFSGTSSSADFALFARKFAIWSLRNFLFCSFPNSPVFSRRYSGSDLALSPVPHRSESVWLWLTTVALEQPPSKSAMLTLLEPPGRKGHQRHRSAQQLLNFGEHGEKWNSGENPKKQKQTIPRTFSSEYYEDRRSLLIRIVQEKPGVLEFKNIFEQTCFCRILLELPFLL